ncbi:MAG: glycosyltransferase family 4 protein [Myxococcaceae bacterium]
MRILYVSQYFPPEMGAPAARVSELAAAWVRAGHEVTVLTGFPNHPTGVIAEGYQGRWFMRERVEGVSVVRVPIYAAANQGFFRRVLSYVSFALSACVVGPFVVKRPDVLIATSPQLLTAVAGAWLSWLKRVPFVFEVRDLWPQSIVAVGALPASHPLIRLLERVEMALYRWARRIVVVTDSFVTELVSRGVPEKKLCVVKNGVDLELFSPQPRDEALRATLGIQRHELMCLYVGTHGMAHGLGTLLDAAEGLRDRPEIRFVFVGEGADKVALKARAQALELKSVQFVDQQPRERIAQFLAACDVACVLLKASPLFKTVLPSKLFEIMGSGRAILLGVDGEARQLVKEAQAGVYAPPESADDIAQALITLCDAGLREKLGRNGRRYVEKHFSRELLAKRYLDELQGILPKSHPRSPAG